MAGTEPAVHQPGLPAINQAPADDLLPYMIGFYQIVTVSTRERVGHRDHALPGRIAVATPVRYSIVHSQQATQDPITRSRSDTCARSRSGRRFVQGTGTV